MAKCRSCGNDNVLDSTHRAGTHLMKHVPTDMDEIQTKKGHAKGAVAEKDTGAQAQPEGGAGAADEKKEKKSKKTKKKEVAEDGEGAGAAEEGTEEPKEKKKKKKKDAEEEADDRGLTGITLESEEIGKYFQKTLESIKR